MIAILAMIALIYPIALAIVSIEHFSECYIDSKIPIWMTAYGFGGIAMVLFIFVLLEYLMIT